MTGISSLAQTETHISLIKAGQAGILDLARQLSTGRKTDSFSGLGDDSLILQRARVDVRALERYTANITSDDRRLQMTISALEEFAQQAKNVSDAINGFGRQSVHQKGESVYDTSVEPPVAIGMTSGEPDVDLDNLTQLADSAFRVLESLLNTKDNTRYLLSGDYATTKPYEGSAQLDARLAALAGQWRGAALSTADFQASLTTSDPSEYAQAITDETVGYAAPLADGSARGVSLHPGPGADLSYEALANDKGLRDVMVAVAYMRGPSFGPVADVLDADGNVVEQGAPGISLDNQKDNFYAVLQTLSVMIEGGVDQVEARVASLHQKRAQLEDYRVQHASDVELLLDIIGDIETVDTDDTAVRLSSLQTQLAISYSIVARTQEFSLANYL
jgi:flagellar hook-associated protein 3 FlgL